MLSSFPRVYPLLGLCSGYVMVMLFNPVRQALGDGFRCIGRYKRIWLTFALLGFGYFLFQFVTFTPIRNFGDLDLNQVISLPTWHWPRFVEIWRETPLPAVEGVAGIFDNATTTYPLSVVAAVLMITNWRGLHGALLRALRKRYRLWSYFIYLILLLSALASLLKPIVFWRLPEWGGLVPAAGLLRISATVDAVAFIFDYLPMERAHMSGLIRAFCSVQISLALHNESLGKAIHAHSQFVRQNGSLLGWFLIICGMHFFCIMICDAIVRRAIADRLAALFLWKFIFACLRGIITGWLLASWVCLFRQCETGRVSQERWIQY